MTRQRPKPKPAEPIAVKPLIKKDYTWYWLAAGLILTVIVYLPSLTNGVTNWDDNEYLTNPYVTNLSVAGIVKIFSVYFFGNYHPLTLLSLGMDRLIGGGSPFMFHFTNLFLHLLNSFFVFLLVKRLTRNNLLAVLTFILFGVHTLHVESVAWISERKDVLYSCFYLLSLIVYTTYASSRKTLYYLLSLLFFLLSLLAKGQAVVLVVILPFIDYLKDRKWFSRNVLLEKAPFLILSLIFGWIAIRAQESANTISYNYFSMPERFSFACYGLVQYLIKGILPIGLSALYPYPPRLSNGNIPLFYWFYIIALPVLLAGSYFLFKRSKIYVFGLSLFFLTVLPLLQLIPVGGAIMADRYFYIPSVGLLLCFAYGLLEIRKLKIRYVLTLLFVLMLSGLSYSRCMVWKDSITLWDNVISKYDYSEVAYCNRGSAYADIGEWEKAIPDYFKVIVSDPKYLKAYYNTGVAYVNLGKWDLAIAAFSKTLEIDPGYVKAYYTRGVAYGNLGQYDKAIADYTKATGIDPNYTDAYFNSGDAHASLGEWGKAIADYTRAIENDPNYIKAYYDRGVAYGNLRQYDKAISDYAKVIESEPKNLKAHYNCGIAFANLGKWDEAIAELSAVIAIDPGYAQGYSDRGVAYATLGQLEKAINDFSRAIEIDPNNTMAYYNRESAYRRLYGNKK
jgi:tetratricopeptide (TPR) repeat protein